MKLFRKAKYSDIKGAIKMMKDREEEDEDEDEKTGIDGEDIDERTGLSLLVPYLSTTLVLQTWVKSDWLNPGNYRLLNGFVEKGELPRLHFPYN